MALEPRNKETALSWKRKGHELIAQGQVREGRELLTNAHRLFWELLEDTPNGTAEIGIIFDNILELDRYFGPINDLARYAAVSIGVDKGTNEKIIVSGEDLFSGTLIVGVTGSGKTSIMTNMALERIQSGESVIVLDPSGSMIRDIIARLPQPALSRTYYLTVKEDRNLYSKHPFSLNLFSYPTTGDPGVAAKQAARNQITLAFAKLFPATAEGVYFNEILRNLTPILLDHPTFTLHQVEDFLLDERYRRNILRTIDNPRTLRYWQRFNSERPQDQREVIRPFLRRLGELLDDDFLPYHIGQKRGLLDIRQAIINREILLIDLPLDQMAYREAAKALGTLIMMQIYSATFSFLDYHGTRPTFTLLVDEFAKWVYNSGSEFTDLLQYGRKYGIRQVLATQHMSQLDEEGLPKSLKDGVTGAKTIISLRTTLQDRKVLAPLFASIGKQPANLYREPLKHLEDATNPPFIKEFYWRVVRPLETAKSKQIEPRTVTVRRDADGTGYFQSRYMYDFGYGEVEFSSERLQELLDSLNNLLYFTQLEQRIDETRLREVVYEYMLLNDFVQIVVTETHHDLRGHPLRPVEVPSSSNYASSDYKKLRKEERESFIDQRDNDWRKHREVIDAGAQRRFDTMFRTICSMLLQNPLAMEDPPSQSEEEMANILHQLPDREGYAKVGNVVYSLRTVELPPRLPENEVRQRWNTILRQTKEKYARKGRAEIRNNLLSSFANGDDAQQQSSQPRNTFPEFCITLDDVGREVELIARNEEELAKIELWNNLITQYESFDPFLRQQWQNVSQLQGRLEDVDDARRHDTLDEFDDVQDF